MRAMARREFLTLGAVAAGAFYFAGWHRLGRSAVRAAQLSVPTVDRLVMTSVVDNIYDVFARGGQVGNVSVQRNPPIYPITAGTQLHTEHGLAYHLESFRADERKEILLDFAMTTRALTNNYERLQVNPGRADALMLSHGHDDHYGGLPALAATVPAWRERQVVLYAGGEDTFCQRWALAPDGQRRDRGQLDRAALEEGGLRVVLAKQPTVVAGHAVTSGQIPRVTAFETGEPSARLEAGEPGSDCDASLHFPPGTLQVETEPGELVQDIFWGEHATGYHLRDRGLVVLSSCGHAGIINSVRRLQAVTGIEKIHAIVGGFHLAPAPDELVAQTVDAFKQINPDYILPMHCTGFNTMMAVQHEMPGKLIMPSTGTRVVFGA